MAGRPRGRKYGKRKGIRRKYGGNRRIRKVPNVYHFKELCQVTNLTVPVGTLPGVLSFNLNQLTNAANFKGMFDMYKITGVKLKMLYRHNMSDVSGGGATNEIPMLYIAPNRDPFAPPPGSVAAILNDDGCKILRCDKLTGKGGLYLKSPKPDMTGTVTTGGVPTGGVVTQNWSYGVGSKWQPWLTTGGNGQSLDQSGVSHFGFRYVVDNITGSQPQNIQLFATLYFSCKEQD